MAQITVAQFRTTFPEFAATARYPDAQVQFWLTLGYKRCRPTPWADLLDEGVQFYTAHNLVLERQAQDSAARGAVPGIATGVINSKSVDKVSLGYDTQAASVEGAGNYNLTTYGTRFMELVNIVGAQAIQVI